MPNYMTEFSPDNNSHVYQIKDEEAAPIDLLKDTVGWTGKNLLPYPYGITSYSANGVTFTVNDDGSVTVNGTATADTPLRLFTGALQNGNYIISRGFTNVLAGIRVEGWSGSTWVKTIVGASSFSSDEPTFTIDNDGYNTVRIDILIKSGAVLNNQKFYPMLRDASIIDSTYEPYHESVEEVVEQIYADNGVLGAKNLLPNTANSGTFNGITYTVNSDKSVTANGTATGGNSSRIIYEGTLPAGKYLFGGGVSDNFRLGLRKTSESSWSGTSVGNSVPITIEENISYSIFVWVKDAVTASNVVFKPMLRLASDPDDSYVPYAMTNRELTEIKESAITNIVSGATTVAAENKLSKIGKIVFLDLALNSVTASAGTAIANIPADYRPRNTTCIMGTSVNVGALNGYVQDGNIKFRENLSSAIVRLHATWITP